MLRPPGGEVPARKGDGVSLIPLAGDAAGVSTESLAFPLNDEPLQVAASRGVSNVVTAEPTRVRLAHGALLVVIRPAAAVDT